MVITREPKAEGLLTRWQDNQICIHFQLNYRGLKFVEKRYSEMLQNVQLSMDATIFELGLFQNIIVELQKHSSHDTRVTDQEGFYKNPSNVKISQML